MRQETAECERVLTRWCHPNASANSYYMTARKPNDKEGKQALKKLGNNIKYVRDNPRIGVHYRILMHNEEESNAHLAVDYSTYTMVT